MGIIETFLTLSQRKSEIEKVKKKKKSARQMSAANNEVAL